jgi:hypothetical protein
MYGVELRTRYFETTFHSQTLNNFSSWLLLRDDSSLQIESTGDGCSTGLKKNSTSGDAVEVRPTTAVQTASLPAPCIRLISLMSSEARGSHARRETVRVFWSWSKQSAVLAQAGESVSWTRHRRDSNPTSAFRTGPTTARPRSLINLTVYELIHSARRRLSSWACVAVHQIPQWHSNTERSYTVNQTKKLRRNPKETAG